MLPATFEKDPDMRTSQAVVGIVAVAIITAGFAMSGLLCFAIRNPLFQNDSVFTPCLYSCAIGLITLFYDFIIFKRYKWNTPAVLTAVAAVSSTIVYTGLFAWTHHKIKGIKTNRPGTQNPTPMNHQRLDSETTLWQDPRYYDNYMRNMWPTAQSRRPAPVGYDPDSITEEEMQRQQMLMLLLQRQQPDTPDPSSSTFHVEWQIGDEDDAPPAGGYYAPNTGHSSTSYPSPTPGIIRQFSNELQQNLRPWDGVWRTPARVHTSVRHQRAVSQADRFARQQEIEQGR